MFIYYTFVNVNWSLVLPPHSEGGNDFPLARCCFPRTKHGVCGTEKGLKSKGVVTAAESPWARLVRPPPPWSSF